MQSPHDKMFRFALRHPAHAASWLAAVLPDRVARAIGWASLRPAAEQLAGLSLRPHLPDATFVAERVDRDEAVLLFLEHKSHPDPELTEQLLRYAVLLRHEHRHRQGTGAAVLAIVLRHGPPHVRAAAAAEDAGADPLGAWQPTMPFVVDDLRERSEHELLGERSTALVRLCRLCLAVLPTLLPEQVPSAFARWQDLLRAVDRSTAAPDAPPLGAEAIDAIGWYALAVTDVVPEVLAETFSRLLHRPENTIMSTLERTYQQGRTEGLVEGKTEGETLGRSATLLRQVQLRFGPLAPTTVAAIEARLLGASREQLERWTDRILTAASPDDLFVG